ncbi:hypothetical protein SCALIN_C31_0022 [Candidatus Scalindua japonica]|uniref:PAS domain-containing protein n=1 Tax=Candidatus Scalindua japonica TaxID=1284222 RepID=A0A286U2N7_9BACT|nr:hypothetical protein [Candidatus Scalindua japonica]GAX62387.1 hypothetical protein SCALIN_C31_0022 [Candidatus Scalindua japonica]
MIEQQNQTFIYRIDRDNKITYVSKSWDIFARENGTPELCEENVKGQPLLDFFSGMEVKHLYRLIFEKSRNTKQSMEFPFRCDSPKLRRYMFMKILYVDEDAIEFETRILREVPRPEIELLDIDAKRGTEFIVMCAWCKCVKTNGVWLEVEQAVNKMRLFDQPVLPRISHGMCKKCELRLKNKL